MRAGGAVSEPDLSHTAPITVAVQAPYNLHSLGSFPLNVMLP